MENSKECIEKLFKKVMSPLGDVYCYLYFKKYLVDPNFFENKYAHGKVSETLLIGLIKKSRYNHLLRWYVPEILFLIDPCCISDKVLEYCLNYKGKFRNTLLIQLGHMWLTVNQLERLNNALQTPEAYFKLLFIYLKPEYSNKELEDFLQKNLRFSKELERSFHYFVAQTDELSAEKQKLLFQAAQIDSFDAG